MKPLRLKDQTQGNLLKMSSYRLAYWHAPKRARHEEDEILDCVFCKYQEGVALMDDVVGFLMNAGFTVESHDDRSFTVTFSPDTDRSDAPPTNTRSFGTLYELISGLPLPERP